MTELLSTLTPLVSDTIISSKKSEKATKSQSTSRNYRMLSLIFIVSSGSLKRIDYSKQICLAILFFLLLKELIFLSFVAN